MYTNFFGLHEKPFELVPDPRYLFLSATHREVLGHLIYGIEQGEGFIAITGEVGTGKTTLCRTLLERLGNDCEIAFLFNPHLSPIDLLKAINAEFGLSTFGDSLPELIEVLNEFLLDRNVADRRVLIIVDEAQTLSTETLEQMRLLSNLETQTSKLLQIVLLGQPELDEKLETHELRQLRQRIAVRWHLGPLTAAETREYVQHRLRIAAGHDCSIFTNSALTLVHRRSSGIPRLINVLCNRALLGAYASNVRKVDRTLVDTAAKEFSGRPRRTSGPSLRRASWVMLAAGVAVASFTVGNLWYAGPGESPVESSLLQIDPRTPEGVDSVPAVALAPPTAVDPLTENFAPALDDASVLDALLPLNTPGTANAAVLAATLETWRLAPIVADSLTFPELFDALTASDLAALPITEGNFDELRRAGLPAILQLKTRDEQLRPVLLRRIEGTRAYLRGILPGETVRTSLAEIETRWRGDAYAIWHDYAGLPGFIEFGDSGPTVEWLQRALAQTGHFSGIPDGGYGETTREAVRAFQIATNISPDGRVGPLTKIRLYQALGDHAPPALIAEPPAPTEP